MRILIIPVSSDAGNDEDEWRVLLELAVHVIVEPVKGKLVAGCRLHKLPDKIIIKNKNQTISQTGKERREGRSIWANHFPEMPLREMNHRKVRGTSDKEGLALFL